MRQNNDKLRNQLEDLEAKTKQAPSQLQNATGTAIEEEYGKHCDKINKYVEKFNEKDRLCTESENGFVTLYPDVFDLKFEQIRLVQENDG